MRPESSLRPEESVRRRVAMVGFTGDCHDNALAEASTLLFTAVLIGDKGP